MSALVDDREPEAVNAVLTFQEPDGTRWLAGALLGPLVREGDSRALPVSQMPDRVLVLVSFHVVRAS